MSSKQNSPSRPGFTDQTPRQAPSLDDAFNPGTTASGDEDDERRVRRGDMDGRGDRGAQEDAERNGLDGLMSDEDYENLVRNEFDQTALPKPPALPGWHLCWLTTTSQYDSIPKRQRIGYRPVRTSEMPGFDPANGQHLENFSGFVTCNEMVLHKIPERYYQQMMKYFHHKKPADDSQTTLEKIKQGLEQEQDSAGNDLGQILGTGLLDMERTTKRTQRASPHFSN